MRGRIPATRDDKIREGKTRNLPEPVRISGRLELVDAAEPPATLHGQIERDWWTTYVPILVESGTVEMVDVPALTICAEAWGDIKRMDAVIAAKGYFIAGSKGQPVSAPWIKQRRDAMIVYERYMQHFGLSPVSRARLGLAHLTGRVMAQELERELGDSVPMDVIDVGVPGL